MAGRAKAHTELREDRRLTLSPAGVLCPYSPLYEDVGYEWAATWTDGHTAEVAFALSKEDAHAAAKLLKTAHQQDGVAIVGRVQSPGEKAEVGYYRYHGDGGPSVRLRRHACARPDATRSTSPTPTTPNPSS